jgi:hypothetical protein
MTNYAVAIYRSETRAALDFALDRRSTNEEHNEFLNLLHFSHTGYRAWLKDMARRYANGEFQGDEE